MIGIDPAGWRIRCDGVWTRPEALTEPVVLPGTAAGHSAFTVAYINNRLVFKGNPTGHLTGQNWYGSNNVHALTRAVIRSLIARDLIHGTAAAVRRVHTGHVRLHELAFAGYWRVGPHRFETATALKSVLAAAVSHTESRHPYSVHLYNGHGAIVRSRTASFTVYCKQEAANAVTPGWQHPLVPDTRAVSEYLRVETTLKYGWFAADRCNLRDWDSTDWDAVATRVLDDCWGNRFHLRYLMTCPNIGHTAYANGWPPPDRAAFVLWMRGGTLDARTRRRLYSRHGLNTFITAAGHYHVLWALLRTSVHATAQHVETRLRHAVTFPTRDALAPAVATTGKLERVACAKTYARVLAACEIA